MAMPASERRLAPDNVPLPTPSSKSQTAGSFSRSGRRVLAELACNDSPVAGLLPAGTPNSLCKDGSGDGDRPRGRRALLPEAVPSQPACTPLGEALLRSQVQLLLQKVGSETGLNQPEKPASQIAMGASPTVLAAPTPFNTPASVDLTHLPPSACERPPLQHGVIHAPGENTDFHMSLILSKGQTGSSEQMCNGAHYLIKPAMEGESRSFQALSSVQVSDTPTSAEIFVGKRVLNFDDDTPYKVSLEEGLSRTILEGEADCSPAMRQLEDDELSEWSVNVNVGSPVDKESLIELSENGAIGPLGANDSSMFCDEHVEGQQASNSKMQLTWDKNEEKTLYESERNKEQQKEDENKYISNGRHDDSSEYGDEYSPSDQDDLCYGGEECNDLCDMFMDMRFREVGHNLPKGEGKHIRFVYRDGDDEIAEAVVVSGEEDVLCSGTALRLNGLPMPLGRHWRFSQDDDE